MSSQKNWLFGEIIFCQADFTAIPLWFRSFSAAFPLSLLWQGARGRTCRLGSWPVSPTPEDAAGGKSALLEISQRQLLGRALGGGGEVGGDLDKSYFSATVWLSKCQLPHLWYGVVAPVLLTWKVRQITWEMMKVCYWKVFKLIIINICVTSEIPSLTVVSEVVYCSAAEQSSLWS